MGKATQAKEGSARDRLADRRAAERHKQATRRRLLTMGGAVVAVIALVVGFIVIKSNQKPPAAAGSATNARRKRWHRPNARSRAHRKPPAPALNRRPRDRRAAVPRR